MSSETGWSVGELAVAFDEHVASISIERPDKLNALTARFWHDLPATLDRLSANERVRVVIITGSGDRAFSAGGDIPGFLALTSIAEIVAYQEAAMAAFRAVEQAPWPVIAAVNGIAYGGGCELMMACDMALAADHARFALPEARLGMVPGFGALRAPEVIGRAMTRYLVSSGDSIDADRALAIGLVQWVVAPDRLMMEATALARRIAAQSPSAVSVGKRMVNRTIDNDAVATSVHDLTALHASADRAIGVAAFLARQPARFTTRDEGTRPVLS